MKTKEAYTDPWIMHLLTRDLSTNDFCGDNCSLFFGDFSVIKTRKLQTQPTHSTQLRLKDWELTTATVTQEGLESSLSWCVTHGISMHQNGGFCMFCETWIEFVFLCDTWFSLCIFMWKVIASLLLWTWSCFRIFCDAWKGQLLMREIVFRGGIGDPLVSV